MSKLVRLKKWLSIPQAAQHLSEVCGEPVSEADILGFCLGGSLTLSAYLVSQAQARSVSLESGALDSDGNECISLGTGQWFRYSSPTVEYISGVWDLVLTVTTSRDYVEGYLKKLLTGDDSEYRKVRWMEYNFIERTDGEHLRRMLIQDAGSDSHQSEIDKKFAHLTLEERPGNSDGIRFFPGILPDDSIFVIRTGPLMSFQLMLSEQSEKPLDTRQRETLFKIIAGLAAELDISTEPRGGGVKKIMQVLARHGLGSISERTLQTYFDEIRQMTAGETQ